MGRVEDVSLPGAYRARRDVDACASFWRPTRLRALTLAAVLTVPWGLASALNAAPIPPNTPPALDRFLSDIADATPQRARLLVAGNPPALIFYRATYRLYPRVVEGYVVRPYTMVDGWVGQPVTWEAAARYARRVHARYIALWESSCAPPATAIRIRRDGGVLAEVSR